MEAAMQDADIVYPKSWAPISVMQQRTTLLHQKDSAGLAQLEKECLLHNAEFKSWEYDNKKEQLTRHGQGLYMHCLPADISGVSCAQGEVAADTFEQWRITTYQQAGYKPYIIAAMMLANRFENPAQVLQKIMESQRGRVKY